MPLFDVPGWSVSDDPIPDSGSRKRKRPSSDTGSSERIHSAEVNLEKLVKKLTGKRDDHDSKSSKSKFRLRQKTKQPQPAADDEKKKNISLPMPLMKTSEKAAKRAKRSHEIRSQASEDSLANQANENQAESLVGLTSMQKNMKQKLDGARFR